MITRVVKMTFKAEKVAEFKAVFEEVKAKIAGFDGCEDVKLMHDISDERIYFTISKWQHPDDLERYRHSPFFADTWACTKIHFDDKPLAWSLEEVIA